MQERRTVSWGVERERRPRADRCAHCGSTADMQTAWLSGGTVVQHPRDVGGTTRASSGSGSGSRSYLASAPKLIIRFIPHLEEKFSLKSDDVIGNIGQQYPWEEKWLLIDLVSLYVYIICIVYSPQYPRRTFECDDVISSACQ